MNSRRNTREFLPALISALAIFLLATISVVAPAAAQKIKQLPPPPPVPIYRPKPTPTPAPEELDVVRVTSNLIAVPVSVTDANGQPVLGLHAADFRIEEDGRAQQVAQLGDPQQVPLDVALLIDVSGTVNARFDFEKDAAARFLSQVLKPVDRAAIFTIDRVPVLQQVRTNAVVAERRLLSLAPAADKGPTAYYDTVIEATRYLAKSTPESHRRVIIVISDGEDNFSNLVRDSAMAAFKATRDVDGSNPQGRALIIAANDRALRAGHQKSQSQVLQEVQQANAVFYSINPSGAGLRLNAAGTRAQNAMQHLASATGGTAFVPGKVEDLTVVFGRIASELRAQYLLQYYSDNKSGGSAFRRIKVTAPGRPELRLRAREGYFPKGQ